MGTYTGQYGIHSHIMQCHYTLHLHVHKSLASMKHCCKYTCIHNGCSYNSNVHPILNPTMPPSSTRIYQQAMEMCGYVCQASGKTVQQTGTVLGRQSHCISDTVSPSLETRSSVCEGLIPILVQSLQIQEVQCSVCVALSGTLICPHNIPQVPLFVQCMLCYDKKVIPQCFITTVILQVTYKKIQVEGGLWYRNKPPEVILLLRMDSFRTCHKSVTVFATWAISLQPLWHNKGLLGLQPQSWLRHMSYILDNALLLVQ